MAEMRSMNIIQLKENNIRAIDEAYRRGYEQGYKDRAKSISKEPIDIIDKYMNMRT